MLVQVLAPALRARLATGDNQLMRFAQLQEHELSAAVRASSDLLKQLLYRAHSQVKEATRAKARLQEALNKEPGKFTIRKMATGTIDDFHKGLQDRIGSCRIARRLHATQRLQCDI
jgi:hypothetical protein